ncbi:XkdX family protein [Brevibacillus brevis]|uniref:XkdX family protein n=1 Tax=Brevibacillus brevis TaxID=1393 RepID=A0A517IGW0_BREBE|nr:XkdX family protein [Brevibacillus brevis]
MDYTKYISLLYRFGEYTAEDVARFVELGKLTPEQYEGITGEKYETSVVEQQEKVQ